MGVLRQRPAFACGSADFYFAADEQINKASEANARGVPEAKSLANFCEESANVGVDGWLAGAQPRYMRRQDPT